MTHTLLLEFLFYGFSVNLGGCSFICWPGIAAYLFMNEKNRLHEEENSGTPPSSKTIFERALIFGLAKIIAAILIASAFYFAQGTAKILFGKYRYIFNIAAGSAIASFGVSLLLPSKNTGHTTRPKSGNAHRLASENAGDKKNFFLLGFISGAAPCAPRIVLLAMISLTAENLWRLILFTTAFQAGELIAPLFIWGAGGLLLSKKRHLSGFGKQFFLSGTLRKITAILLILSGVRFFFN